MGERARERPGVVVRVARIGRVGVVRVNWVRIVARARSLRVAAMAERIMVLHPEPLPPPVVRPLELLPAAPGAVPLVEGRRHRGRAALVRAEEAPMPAHRDQRLWAFKSTIRSEEAPVPAHGDQHLLHKLQDNIVV